MRLKLVSQLYDIWNMFFPNQGFEMVIDQFMLGDQILVAPVLVKGMNSRKVKFPKGKWRSELGEIYDGGKSIEIVAPIERLPRFEKID